MDLQLSTPSWQFLLPVPPEALDVTYQGITVPFTSITDGLFEIPSGRQPQGFSFSVLLPSQATLHQLFPDMSWQSEADFTSLTDPTTVTAPPLNYATDPLVYVADLQQALESNKMQVYVRCPQLRADGVYLAKQFGAHHAGPFGDVQLSIAFSEYRPVSLTTTTPGQAQTGPVLPAPPAGGSTQNDGTPHQGQAYTTRAGDTLATIAQRCVAPPSSQSLIDAAAGQIWAYDGNQAAIEAAGGQRDGSLPVGIPLQIPTFAFG